MNSTPYIFKERFINSRLAHFTRNNIPDFDAKYKEICKWCNATADQYLDRTKETAVQGAFMTRLFNQVFGYLEIVDDGECYHQEREFKTILDTTEADGALGFFYKDTGKKDVRVVIELKDARTPLDKKQNRSNHLTPVEQAFSYANKNGSKCGWVIVSNFVETRLYKSTSSLEYETFDMRKMKDEKEFLRFYYFLCRDHLISETGKSVIDDLYQENEAEGVDITNQFYKTYKEIRNNLFSTLKANNPDKDELLLFTKTQKLMDRFIFICFCEDCDLLPRNIFQKLIENAKQSFVFSPNKLWDNLRGLFSSIDKGNPPMKINRYNGGLFKPDPELDCLTIPDEALEKFTQLSTYDFNSDLNVNILGQIFEQSISDVEQIKNEISGEKTEGKGKQKEDGIYYTPYYVTRYIVEQTVGVYLASKKEELKRSIFSKGEISVSVKRPSTKYDNTIKFNRWVDIPAETDNMTEDEEMFVRATKQLHLLYWIAYEEVLKTIKICDPACGSGAFLNQCFDYLREEMDYVLDMKAQYDAQQSLFDIDKEILQNNLYGVDINPESVEITKLSLWLKTAKNNQTLATLDDNIKCGNSIIADPNVAENAFQWEKEFPAVFANGGFDIIVGNPPYGAKVDNKQKDYCKKHYQTVSGGFDTYRVFFELGFNILKNDGYLGYITPNTYFDILSGKKLRQFLFKNTLHKIVEVYNVFPNAVVEPLISIYQKKPCANEKFEIILVPRKTALSSTFVADGVHSTKTQQDLQKNENLIFNYKIDAATETVVEGVRSKAQRLDELFFVFNGAKPYEVGKGVPPQTKEMTENKVYNCYKKEGDDWVPYIRGKQIQRFTTTWDGEYIKYGENLAAPRNPDIFFREKLFVRQTGDTIIAQIDNGNVSNNTLHVVFSKDEEAKNRYLLGLLNSTFMTWFYQVTHPLEVGKPMAEVKKNFVEELPIIEGASNQKELIIKISNELLLLCEARHKSRQQFIEYLENAYEPKRITERLEEFDLLSFKEFCEELKQQKVKLSASEQMSLLSLFKEKTEEIAKISSQISTLQEKLDDEVFLVYGIDQSFADRIRNELLITL